MGSCVQENVCKSRILGNLTCTAFFPTHIDETLTYIRLIMKSTAALNSDVECGLDLSHRVYSRPLLDRMNHCDGQCRLAKDFIMLS